MERQVGIRALGRGLSAVVDSERMVLCEEEVVTLYYKESDPVTVRKASAIRESSAGTVFSKGSEVSRGEEASCSPIRSCFRSW